MSEDINELYRKLTLDKSINIERIREKAFESGMLNGVSIMKKTLIGEFITYLKNRELDFAEDVDTIQFTIEGLEREGIEYIIDFNKEYEERERE